MFGSDGSPIVQYVVIFAVIFTALAAIVFTVRRITGRSLALPGRGNGRGRQPRLGIVDVYELDRARQLILLRRDNVEHLLLVGGPNDVVVERNIQRGQRPLPEAALRSEAGPDSLDEPLADPLVQGGRLPEPPRALQDNPGRRAEPLFDPGFAMPVVVPPPVPRSSVQPAVTLPIDAALLADDETGPEASAAFMPPLRAPVAESPAAPREPASPRRIFSRTPPPLVEPRTGPASESGTIPGPAAGLDEPSRQAPSLTVPSERRSVDPAVLSDMARQLQAALSRPSSAVTSAPVPALPFDGVDPMAATMAAEQRVLAPVPSPEPVPAFAPVPIPAPEPPPALEPVPEAVSKPAAASRPAPLPAVPASAPKPVEPPSVQIAVEAPPVSPQRSIEPPPLAPSPSLPADAPPPPQVAAQAVPAPASKGSGTPFSVEEIEAEFARLLGRPLDKRT